MHSFAQHQGFASATPRLSKGLQDLASLSPRSVQRSLQPLRRRTGVVRGRSDSRQDASPAQHASTHEDDPWRSSHTPQQQQPPYRIIAGLASAGAALTAYLTWQRLTGGPVLCLASGGCSSVLGSDYATVFGLPLSLLGMLGYGGVAALGVAGASGEAGSSSLTRQGVLAGGAVLATTSTCLLYVLATQFPGESCTWCLTSAALSFGTLVAAASGFTARDLQQVAPQGAALALTTVLGLSLAWSGARPPNALANIELDYRRVPVEAQSSQEAVSLAKRLSSAGAKMYGAFWCSHCHEQKEAFGHEAMADFPYVECYPDGFGKGKEIAKACSTAKVEGFPAWVIGGKKYEGEQTFAQLEKHLNGL